MQFAQNIHILTLVQKEDLVQNKQCIIKTKSVLSLILLKEKNKNNVFKTLPEQSKLEEVVATLKTTLRKRLKLKIEDLRSCLIE